MDHERIFNVKPKDKYATRYEFFLERSDTTGAIRLMVAEMPFGEADAEILLVISPQGHITLNQQGLASIGVAVDSETRPRGVTAYNAGVVDSLRVLAQKRKGHGWPTMCPTT